MKKMAVITLFLMVIAIGLNAQPNPAYPSGVDDELRRKIQELENQTGVQDEILHGYLVTWAAALLAASLTL